MPCYSFGSFLLDSDSRTLSTGGEPIALTSRNFDTLLLLVQNRGRPIEKSELLSRVWRNTAVEEGNLTQAIFCIRKALDDPPRHHRFIATVPGIGYQFVAQVTETSPVTDTADPKIRAAERQSGLGLHFSKPRLAGAAMLCIAALCLAWWAREQNTPALGAILELTSDGKPKTELVTDGVRVFYASPADPMLSRWRTFEVPATGGETRLLPFSRGDMSPIHLSPDRTELLLGPSAVRQANAGWTTPERLWLQRLAGGPPRISALQGHDAGWSPDNKQIAFAAFRQIHLADNDGTSIRKLTDLPGVASGLRWSPDGQRIRFTLHSGTALKDTAIWEIAAKGGAPHPVFAGSNDLEAAGDWSADGRYYFFTRVTGGVSQIWAAPDGSPWFRKRTQDPVQLTTGPMECYLPTPSPDRTRLFFFGVRQRTSLLKQNRRSGEFEPFLPGISGRHVDFSRDGKWVTYSSYPERSVWRAAADGTHRLQLTPPPMIGMLPVISPDGSRVAFVGGPPRQPGFIYVVGTNGGELDAIVAVEPAGLIEPAWSPDGNSLALGSLKPETPLHRFDFAHRKLSILPGAEHLQAPRWSPDGNSIAAVDSRSGNLVLYDLRSHRTAQLTTIASYNFAWGHDGRFLYFGSGSGVSAGWFRVRVADGKTERLGSLALAGALPAKPSRGLPTWIYMWTGLTPDDSLLIARELGTTEIYSAVWNEH